MSHSIPNRLLLALLIWVTITGLHADETNLPPASLTLKDVVRLVGDQNPRIRAEKEAIASARADRMTAGAYPNPKVSVDHQEPNGTQQTLFTGDRQEQVSAEFPILIPGQRSSRIAKADADVSAAEAHAAVATIGITADACASFMRLLAAQRRHEILSNALVEITRLKETIAGRAAEGAASAYEVTRVEVEVGVLAGRLDSARVESVAEAGELAALAAMTNGLPTASGTLSPWEVSLRDLYDPTLRAGTSPALVAATREAAAAETGIRAAKTTRWPELSLEGGRAWTRHPYSSADFVGLSVEIPLFDTRRGQLEKAKSDARAAEARKAAVAAETEATIRQLAETVERRQRVLDRYTLDLEPKLARLKEMSSDAYLMGKHTILELIDGEQTRREVMLEHIDMQSALIEAQIHFLAATGQLRRFLESSER